MEISKVEWERKSSLTIIQQGYGHRYRILLFTAAVYSISMGTVQWYAAVRAQHGYISKDMRFVRNETHARVEVWQWASKRADFVISWNLICLSQVTRPEFYDTQITCLQMSKRNCLPVNNVRDLLAREVKTFIFMKRKIYKKIFSNLQISTCLKWLYANTCISSGTNICFYPWSLTLKWCLKCI